MASDSEPIKYSDLAEEGALTQFLADVNAGTEGLKKFEEASQKIISLYKNGAKTTVKGLAGIDDKSVDTITKYDAALRKLQETEKGISQQEKEILYFREKEKAIRKERENAIRNEVKAQMAAKGSIAEMRAELAKLNAEYVKMAGSTKEEIKLRDEQGKKILELSDKIGTLEEKTGNHHRSVGNYQKGLKGLSGVLLEVAKAFGINTEVLERLEEGQKLLFKSAKEAKEAVHHLGLSHKANAAAATEEAAAEKASTVAKSASIPVIGLVIAAVVALTGIILEYAAASREAKLEEMERSAAMDGTIILNKEARDAYNEHLMAVQDLADGYKVLRGEMTEFDAELSKITRETILEATNLMNEGIAKEQEARKKQLTDYLRDYINIITLGNSAILGLEGSTETARKRAEKAREERMQSVQDAIRKGRDKAAAAQLEQDKKHEEERRKVADDAEKKRIEDYKKRQEARLKLHEGINDALAKIEEEKNKKNKRDDDQAIKDWIGAKRGQYEWDAEQLAIRQKKEEALRKERIERLIQEQEMIVNYTFQALNAKLEKQKQYNQYELSMIDSQLQAQIALAQAGQENLLDQTLKAKAENIAEQKELDRKARLEKEAQQLAEIFLEYEKAYAKEGPAAAQKALADTLIAKGIAAGISAAFAEEGGILGDTLDTDYKLFSKKHKTGKEVVVQAQEGEGFISLKDMANLKQGILPGWMKKLYNPQMIAIPGTGQHQVNVLAEKLTDLERALRNSPRYIIHPSLKNGISITHEENGISRTSDIKSNPIIRRS
jgi:hypothetical protein